MSRFATELPGGLASVGVFILYKMDDAQPGSTYRIALPSVKLGANVVFKNANGNYLRWRPDNGSPLGQRFGDRDGRTVILGDEANREVTTTASGDFFFTVHNSDDNQPYPVTYNLRVAQDFPGASDAATLRWDSSRNQFRVVLQGVHGEPFAVEFRKENFADTVILRTNETGESFTMVGDAPVFWLQDPYEGDTGKTITFKVLENLTSIEALGSDDGDVDIEPPDGPGQ